MDAGETPAIVDRIGHGRVAVRMVVAVMMMVIMVVIMMMPIVTMIVWVIVMMPIVGMRMAIGIDVAALAVMVMMIVIMRPGLCAWLAAGLLITATANRTHQATSSSFTRISSPAVTCSW
jgi:hypothetical protein